MVMADTNTSGSLMPKGVMERLGKFGYAVSGTRPESVSQLVTAISARILSLPGVSNDPTTKAAIELILRMELNPDADPLDIPEGTTRQGASDDRGAKRARKVVDLPGV